MAPSTNLEERFNLAVQTIQNLPKDGVFQPSNLTKLIFYGLYKQATSGPCNESQPSMFNYIARAKWEAWHRYRIMTKEQAMLEYIDEIRKIIPSMPQTNEVLEFKKSMGFSTDDQPKETNPVAEVEQLEQPTTPDDIVVITNDSAQAAVASGITSVPTSTPTSSSSSSSISSTDIDEFYDDPSDILSLEIASNDNLQQTAISTTRLHHSSHASGGQNGAIIPARNSTRNGNSHSHVSSTHLPSFRSHNPSYGAQYSASSIASGTDDGHYPTNNYNKETQRAILSALTKLQRDIHNILQRLNRLETSANLLQQRELSLESDSSSKWFPLSGFRRGTIAFILLWPFLAFVLIRLYLRAKIIIRFRR